MISANYNSSFKKHNFLSVEVAYSLFYNFPSEMWQYFDIAASQDAGNAVGLSTLIK